MDSVKQRKFTAKISRPAISGSYLRKDVFRELDRALEAPILWISAPAGSGKTTLASGYLENRGLSHLWLQLDEADADPAAFFHYLRLAAPKGSESLPLFTQEYRQRPRAFARYFFERLGELAPQSFFLVFDNYQEMTENSPLHEMFAYGLKAHPEKIRVMILSRSAPPKPFARLRAIRKLACMTWDDIRFSFEETREIIKLKGPLGLEDSEIKILHEKCQGWAAGLILMLELLHTHSLEELTSIRGGACREIFDYFASELFDRLEASLQSFLIRTAFLPKIQVDAAKVLAGVDRAGEILSMLARNQYFTTRSTEGEPTYQYHPLFRDFLFNTAQDRLSPEAVGLLTRLSADLLEKAGWDEDALKLSIGVQNWEKVIRIILKNARQLLFQGRCKTLERWILNAPVKYREKYPWLWYWLGVCRSTEDLPESRKHLQRAYFRFKRSGEISGIYMSWSEIVAGYILEWGDMKPLDGWVDEMDNMQRKYGDFLSSSPEVAVGPVLGYFCALMYRRPEKLVNGRWESRLCSILFQTEDADMKLAIGNNLMMYYLVWTGDHAKAELLFEALKPYTSQNSPAAPIHYIVWRSMEGAFHFFMNRIGPAREAIQKGIAKAERSGVQVWNFMMFSLTVYISMLEGEIRTAEKYLEKLSFILDTSRKLDIAHYYYLKSFMELCRKRRTLSLRYIETANEYSNEAASPMLHRFFVVARAEVLIDMKNLAEAEPLIGEASEYGVKTGNQYLLNHCYRLLSTLYFQKGDHESGFKNLRKYLVCGRKYRIFNHNWWRSSVMAELLAKALGAKMEVEHVKQLIREHRIAPGPNLETVDEWPYPLKIYCLGGFRVLLDEKPITMKRKSGRKPLDLLKALIAFGGRDVAEERLADALWPDADGESAHKAFNTTLYRLRKLIEWEQALVLKSRRLNLNPEYCWVDVDSFDRDVQRAHQLIARSSCDEKKLMRLSKRIVSTYKGPFLEGDHAAWVIPARERFHYGAIRVLKQIGDYLESIRRMDDAVHICECSLEIDPLAESAYQRLMRCHHRMGRKAEALAVYRRCRITLRRTLNTTPSSKTEKLRDMIQSL